MRIARTRTVLLKTSGLSDIKRSGPELGITGLEPIFVPDIVKITQLKYRAEVVKVETIGASLYTPQANTAYIVEIGDYTSREGHNNAISPKRYIYRTPSDLTEIGATAALQREAINAGLVAKINLDSANNVVAASLGSGNGFTITDDAGYFPARTAAGIWNREGKTSIKLDRDSNGRGFVDAIDRVLTTDAIYSFGVGARLLADVAVISALGGGNVVSGSLDTPVSIDGTPAVSGQQYDAFQIDALILSQVPTIGEVHGYRRQSQMVFVDNGKGTATTNAAGFLTFERQLHKLLFQLYRNDPKSVIEFFDLPFVIQGPLGAVPTTTGANKFLTPYGALVHNNIGTQTIVAPVLGNAGLLSEQDTTATEGSAYTPNLTTICDQQFVVGTTGIGFLFKLTVTTVANIWLKVGLRVKAAHTADFNDYTDAALVGTKSTGTQFTTYGILGNAATVATDTGANMVTAVESEFRVQVDGYGVVSVYINNIKYPIYSVGTTPLVFPVGTILIPHVEYTNLNSAAAVPNYSELITVADDKWKIDA